MSDQVVQHEDGTTSLHAKVVESNVSASQVGAGPSVAAAAAINLQQPRAATVADVVCALHAADPDLAERAMKIHEDNADHMRSMDKKNVEIASRDQRRIATVEIVGALVLPTLALGLVAALYFLAKAGAPAIAYPAASFAFIMIGWVVKAEARNVHLNARIGSK